MQPVVANRGIVRIFVSAQIKGQPLGFYLAILERHAHVLVFFGVPLSAGDEYRYLLELKCVSMGDSSGKDAELSDILASAPRHGMNAKALLLQAAALAARLTGTSR